MCIGNTYPPERQLSHFLLPPMPEQMNELLNDNCGCNLVLVTKAVISTGGALVEA